jgi:DNA-binding beta-propeller fold protein YncE
VDYPARDGRRAFARTDCVKLAVLTVVSAALLAPASQARVTGGAPVALVAAETTNQLVAVELPSGRVLERLPMPRDPQNVAVCGRTAAVVSVRAGAVTLVDTSTLEIRLVLRGFGAPHIPACSPDGRYIYVTDDARGQLAVIRDRVIRKVFVGYGAHHMTPSPDQPRIWLALGERARSIGVVDTTKPARPRLIGHVDPHGLAHDLAFGPNGRRVWVTYDAGVHVRIFDAATRRPLKALYGGAPPQHIAFDSSSKSRRAYVTSGDDGTLRVISLATGRTQRVVRMPLGSFNLTTFGSFVLASSLTSGTLTELSESGRLLLNRRVAPSARDAAVAVLP